MRSQNGWSVYTSAPAGRLDYITGRVRPGDVQVIFEYLCERFDKEVENIRQDWSWGWNYRPIRGSSSGYSNHASGTAIDLNAPAHPLGKRGTFSNSEKAAIHAILRDLEGVVRWGGDYQNRADEMHFEINSSSANVARVARKIRNKNMEEDLTPAQAKELKQAAQDSAAALKAIKELHERFDRFAQNERKIDVNQKRREQKIIKQTKED